MARPSGKVDARAYLVRAGRHGEDEEYALDNDVAVVGYRDVASLEHADTYEQVQKLVTAIFPDDAKPLSLSIHVGQMWRFVREIREGDLVILPRKRTSQIAIVRVTGPYRYTQGSTGVHTRSVEWLKPEIPRATFQTDLLHSFGAAMTVCRIKRNNAVQRIQAVIASGKDPGPELQPTTSPEGEEETFVDGLADLAQAAHDQIVARIQSRFRKHELARLVGAVLEAEGWVTDVSPPGPDGGVDILAGRGALGLDAPKLCVQVKSQRSPANVTTYRTLLGSMQTFSAEQGLLVCWGGFNRAVLKEARQGHFSVRLWDSSDLVEAIYRNYQQLPAEIQAELPLKRVWMLVAEEGEG